MKATLRVPPDFPLAALATLGVGVLLWMCDAFTLVPTMGGHSAPTMAAILAAACVLQIVAARHPWPAIIVMTVLLAADASSGGSLPLWIAMSDLVFAATVAGPQHLRRLVVGGGLAVTIAIAAVVTVLTDPRLGVMSGLLASAFLLSPLGYAWSVVATRRAAAAERATSAAQQLAARGAERRRLSRELHDTVAGHVSAIAILAEAARDLPDPQTAIASMRSSSLAALTELRTMIDLLAADGDDDLPVQWDGLQPLIAAANAVGARVTVTDDIDTMPADVETVLTRIAGEAIANATKHAPGEDVLVEMCVDGRRAVLTVTNRIAAIARRRGSVTMNSSGTGVRNMISRAESIGGSVTAGPSDGRWVVRAQVPVYS